MCSRTNLKAALGGSDTDLEDALREIRRLGYPLHETDSPFERAQSLQLKTAVAVVNRRRFQEGLKTRVLGRRLACHLEVRSTSDVAMEAGLRGAPHGSVVLAEHQTAGRGRCGRDWYSPPGVGLWFSILLRFKLTVEESWMLTLGAGVAVSEAMEAATGIRPDLMWPNDVLIGRRKLAGILTEARLEGPRIAFAVVGIGINVAQDVTDFPPDLRGRATSVKMASGRTPDRSCLLGTVLERLESVYSALRPEPIRSLWKARSSILGSRVNARSIDGQVEGIAEDVTAGGALSVRLDDGRLASVRFGEVEAIRELNRCLDDAPPP